MAIAASAKMVLLNQVLTVSDNSNGKYEIFRGDPSKFKFWPTQYYWMPFLTTRMTGGSRIAKVKHLIQQQLSSHSKLVFGQQGNLSRVSWITTKSTWRIVFRHQIGFHYHLRPWFIRVLVVILRIRHVLWDEEQWFTPKSKLQSLAELRSLAGSRITIIIFNLVGWSSSSSNIIMVKRLFQVTWCGMPNIFVQNSSLDF